MIHTACVFDAKKPSGRLIAVTRSKPRSWTHEWRSLFSPSQPLLNAFRQGYVSQAEFERRYRVEMRHLYRTTTFLQELAAQSQQEDIVLCGYEPEGAFCHRYLLKEILGQISAHQSDDEAGTPKQEATPQPAATQEEPSPTKRQEATRETSASKRASGEKPLNAEQMAKMSASELVQLQTRKRMPLSDRHQRIAFLEQRYGKALRGKTIRFMNNSQLYALSKQAGY